MAAFTGLKTELLNLYPSTFPWSRIYHWLDVAIDKLVGALCRKAGLTPTLQEKERITNNFCVGFAHNKPSQCTFQNKFCYFFLVHKEQDSVIPW